MSLDETPKPKVRTLMTGIMFGEPPRWGDDGRLIELRTRSRRSRGMVVVVYLIERLFHFRMKPT